MVSNKQNEPQFGFEGREEEKLDECIVATGKVSVLEDVTKRGGSKRTIPSWRLVSLPRGLVSA